MDNTPIPVTEEKLEALKDELERRKVVLRNEIAKRLVSAKELGDLKENAEYHAARDDQGKNESRIREVEEILRRAEIITKSDSGIVELASEVTIKRTDASDTKIFTLVGPEEADMAAGKLSAESPIGKELMGKQKGDVISIVSPNGTSSFEIIAVA